MGQLQALCVKGENMVYPQSISIDTSVFGDIASDYYGHDSNKRALAHDTISFIIDNGLSPFFSIHHLSEHLQHRDAGVVAARLSLIGEFPAVSWVKGSVPALPGSIIDIVGTELSLMLKGTTEAGSILRQARQSLVQYGAGIDFINYCGDSLMAARDMGCFQTQKSKEIDSLLHLMDPDTLKVRLSDLKGATRRTSDEAVEYFEKLKMTIGSNLVSRGDRKLDKAKEVADRFVQEVKEDSRELLQNNDLSFYNHILEQHGLIESDIGEGTTIGDLGSIAVHKEQINVIARSYNIDIDKAQKIPMKSIPSSFIVSEIERSMRKEGRAHGSNIIDKYMAVFSLYVDFNIVDKRVNEYFRQLSKKNNGFVKYINSVAKVSHYSEIETYCKSIT